MSDNIFDIEVEGLDPVIQKFRNYPKALNKRMNEGMEASLDVVHGEVPGYPPKRENQKTPYIRTGTLGRSLGVTMGGAKTSASPDHIRVIEGQGAQIRAYFGTNLKYAPYVIGDPDTSPGRGQAWMHKMWWWTLDFVSRKAKDKVLAVWNKLIQQALDD